MIRILFTGSRDWMDEAPVRAVIDALPADAVVVHGAERGLDAMVDRLAKARGLRIEAHPAKWREHAPGWCRCSRGWIASGGNCRKAGPRRNQAMLDAGLPVVVHAFPLPDSKGTWDMVRRAERAGVRVVVHGGGR